MSQKMKMNKKKPTSARYVKKDGANDLPVLGIYPTVNPFDRLTEMWTPQDKAKATPNVYRPDKVTATVTTIPNDSCEEPEDGFVTVVYTQKVETDRRKQSHHRPNTYKKKSSSIKKKDEKKGEKKEEKKKEMMRFTHVPIKAYHFTPKELLPRGEVVHDSQQRSIPLRPFPTMPDRSEFFLAPTGLWGSLPQYQEESEIKLIDTETFFDTISELFMKHLNDIRFAGQEEMENIGSFATQMEILYKIFLEQNDAENALKAERLYQALHNLIIYSMYLVQKQWLSHKKVPPKTWEETLQNIAVWFFELISIYQEYRNLDEDVVRTGHELQVHDLALHNLLHKGGFFTLLPRFLGDHESRLRSVFEEADLVQDIMSEPVLSARIFLQTAIWLISREKRQEHAVRLAHLTNKVMRWNNQEDSLSDFVFGDLFVVLN